MGRHLGLSEGLEMWPLSRSRAHMTSRTAQLGYDLQRGPGKAGGVRHEFMALGLGSPGWTRLPRPPYPAPSLPESHLPGTGSCLSPSRRTPYKATFCRMSNREGIGSLFAKFRVDPRQKQSPGGQVARW